MSFEGAAITAAWVALILLGFAVAAMALQIAWLRRYVGIGRDEPGLTGTQYRLESDADVGGLRVVGFLSPDCLSCDELYDSLVEFAGRPEAHGLQVLAFTRGATDRWSDPLVRVYDNSRA